MAAINIFDRFGKRIYDGANIELGNVSKGTYNIASLFSDNVECTVRLLSSALSFFAVDDNNELLLVDKTTRHLVNDDMTANIIFNAVDVGNNVCAIEIVVDDIALHINVTATVVDADERLLVMMSNMGHDYLEYYNKALMLNDIRQDVVDFILQNSKAREWLIRRDDIDSKLGTYNGLHAALDWLGYSETVRIYEVLKSLDGNNRTLLPLQDDISPYAGMYKRTNLLQLTYEYNEVSGKYLNCGMPEFVKNMADNQDLLLKLQYLVMILEDVFLPEHIHFADVSIDVFASYMARYLYGTDNAEIVTSKPYTPAAQIVVKDMNAFVDEDIIYIRPHTMLLPSTAFEPIGDTIRPNKLNDIFIVTEADIDTTQIDAEYFDWLIDQSMDLALLLELDKANLSFEQPGGTKNITLTSNRAWDVQIGDDAVVRSIANKRTRIWEIAE